MRCSTTSSYTTSRGAKMATEDRIALCIARFYEGLADALEEGARDALEEAGVNEIDRFEVPGAFELPSRSL